MKFSKTFFLVLSILITMISCQTRVVTPNKPMYDNTLELYKKYTIRTKDAKSQKIEVIKVDATKIYGKNKAGEKVEIERSEVRDIKKPNVVLSVLIGLAAVAAVIFIPI
ncbi:bacteriophage spanin2 family protein [Epilithonimonas sp.]|uniref:bacteriophage spanin2 family protein n=1 Tax=Epilithonimonas sp. TaxID=2894511 RepID=UPI0028A21FDE|nr:bacteriophage spanin2 family protein [Epilithonimonas sp.]